MTTENFLLKIVVGLRRKLIILFILLISGIILFSLVNISIQNNHNNLINLQRLNNAQFQSWYKLSERFQFIVDKPSKNPPAVLQKIAQDILTEISNINNVSEQIRNQILKLRSPLNTTEHIHTLSQHIKESPQEIEFLNWTKNALNTQWVIKSPEQIKLTRPVQTVGLIRKLWFDRLNSANTDIGILIESTRKASLALTITTIALLLLFLFAVFYTFLRPALQRLQIAAKLAAKELATANTLTSLVEDISSKDKLFLLDNAQIQETLNKSINNYPELDGLSFKLNNKENIIPSDLTNDTKILDSDIGSDLNFQAEIKSPINNDNLNIQSSFVAITNHVNSTIEMRKRLEAEKQRDIYHNAIETTFNSIPQLIALFDVTDTMLFANQSFKTFLEFDDSISTNTLLLDDVDTQHQYFQNSVAQNKDAKNIFSKGKASETTITYRDGESLLWARIPVQDLGLLFIGQNVTSLKREVVKIEQQRKFEYLGRFSGRIAHDSNNFLAIILNSLELLQQKLKLDLNEEQLFNQAVDTCHTIANRNNELLGFTRRQNLIPEIVHPKKVITEIQAFLQPHKNIEFKATHNLKALTYTDPDNLMSLILNIVKNSLEAMEYKGEIGLEIDISNNMTRYTLTDDGPGFTEEALSNASIPFYTTKEIGTGLGLAAAQDFATQSGGSFSLRNQGKGAFVEILLPLTIGSDYKPSKQKEVTPKPNSADSISVLILEDNEQLAEILEESLNKINCNVTIANQVNVAHEVLKNRTFDFLLTDIILPDGLGFEIAEKLHKNNPKTEIIYMTGYGTTKFQKKITRTPGKVLKKPFKINALIELIQN